jgi:hypothetical protein
LLTSNCHFEKINYCKTKKAILICNPGTNGLFVFKREMMQLAALVKKHDLDCWWGLQRIYLRWRHSLFCDEYSWIGRKRNHDWFGFEKIQHVDQNCVLFQKNKEWQLRWNLRKRVWVRLHLHKLLPEAALDTPQSYFEAFRIQRT